MLRFDWTVFVIPTTTIKRIKIVDKTMANGAKSTPKTTNALIGKRTKPAKL